MIRPTPTLVALAFAGMTASTAVAVDIGDSTTKISFGLQLQERAEVSRSTAEGDTYDRNTGALTPGADTPYDVTNGVRGYPDVANFYVRRARFFVKGDYQTDWHFNLGFRADRADQNSTAAAGRTFVVQTAYISRDFKSDNWTQTLKGGLDYAFFCRADMGPSSAMLMPTQRATHSLSAQRGTGVEYLLAGPFVTWGVDVQNNAGNDSNTAGAATNQNKTNEGLWTSTRVELTPTKDMGWNIGKWQESYAGAPGHGIALGIEAGRNTRDVVTTVSETAIGDVDGSGGAVGTYTTNTGGVTYITKDTTCIGTDLLFHFDGLTALTEGRWQTDKYKIGRTAPAGSVSGSQKAFIWLVQAGYAIVTGEKQAVEPALRYTHIDQNKDFKDETAAFGAQDYGASGNQIETCVNYYFNQHGNQIGLVWTHWKAEKGDSKADIVRLQHQINF